MKIVSLENAIPTAGTGDLTDTDLHNFREYMQIKVNKGNLQQMAVDKHRAENLCTYCLNISSSKQVPYLADNFLSR